MQWLSLASARSGHVAATVVLAVAGAAAIATVATVGAGPAVAVTTPSMAAAGTIRPLAMIAAAPMPAAVVTGVAAAMRRPQSVVWFVVAAAVPLVAVGIDALWATGGSPTAAQLTGRVTTVWGLAIAGAATEIAPRRAWSIAAAAVATVAIVGAADAVFMAAAGRPPTPTTTITVWATGGTVAVTVAAMLRLRSLRRAVGPVGGLTAASFAVKWEYVQLLVVVCSLVPTALIAAAGAAAATEHTLDLLTGGAAATVAGAGIVLGFVLMNAAAQNPAIAANIQARSMLSFNS